MEFMGTGMLTTLGCGCCCLAVVAVVGVAGVLGMRRRARTEAAVGGVEEAPERGSSTAARLTYMENAAPAPSPAPRQASPLRELPRQVADTTRPGSGGGGPRVVRPTETFVPPADEE
jgi:hypothetical protein